MRLVAAVANAGVLVVATCRPHAARERRLPGTLRIEDSAGCSSSGLLKNSKLGPSFFLLSPHTPTFEGPLARKALTRLPVRTESARNLAIFP